MFYFSGGRRQARIWMVIAVVLLRICITLCLFGIRYHSINQSCKEKSELVFPHNNSAHVNLIFHGHYLNQCRCIVNRTKGEHISIKFESKYNNFHKKWIGECGLWVRLTMYSFAHWLWCCVMHYSWSLGQQLYNKHLRFHQALRSTGTKSLVI